MCGLVVHNLLLQQGRLQGVVERIQVRAAIFCTLYTYSLGHWSRPAWTVVRRDLDRYLSYLFVVSVQVLA